MEKYIIGIDLGGMSAKGALFTIDGELLCTDKAKTDKNDGFEGTVLVLARLARRLTEIGDVDFSSVVAIGVGAPGVVDSNAGMVLRWSNYSWQNAPLAKELSLLTGKKVFILNDANAAALGEAKFGATSQYQSSILLTLGTGVGGGIVFDGKLIEGYKSAGAELGHITIRKGGIPCACGRRGCYEKYASATALISQTRHAMVDNPQSSLWDLVDGKLENVDGRTVFVAMRNGDETAKRVVEEYVGYVSEGIADLVNILRPEAIVLGGGVANEGETLFQPLRKAVDERSYIAMDIVPLKVVGAQLGNRAGVYGAYVLAKEKLSNE
ncbi:MAG: ROK family protein [Clostridiales bacterium]|nr:ROK family protein [Clostridiales bacterium]